MTMNTVESVVTQRFRDEGFPDAKVIGSGMEGTVYRLRPGTVAKVWYSSSRQRLLTLQQFYKNIVQAGLSFATPEIYDVWQVSEHSVSVEREILGRTLESWQPLRASVWPHASNAIVEILNQFRLLSPSDALSALPVLDEQESFSGSGAWPQNLAHLVRRRVDRFHPVLVRRVASLDAKVAAVLHHLEQHEHTLAGIACRGALIHGDLIPANIIVDDNLRPTAVVDFGFLSTYGDSAFDAAVAASIFEMYGPAARAIEHQLDQLLLPAVGADPETFAIYRAAYALITANAYDPDGADGHFRWCVDILARPEVCAVLGVSPVTR
jgi:hypothetical protein